MSNIFQPFIRSTGGAIPLIVGVGAIVDPIPSQGLNVDALGNIHVVADGDIIHYHQGLPFDTFGRLCLTTEPLVRYDQSIPFAANNSVSVGSVIDYVNQGLAYTVAGSIAFVGDSPVTLWTIEADAGGIFGYVELTATGGLSPRGDIQSLYVVTPANDVFLKPDDGISGSGNVDVTSLGNTVTLVWDSLEQYYAGNDATFAAAVEAAVGTSVEVSGVPYLPSKDVTNFLFTPEGTVTDTGVSIGSNSQMTYGEDTSNNIFSVRRSSQNIMQVIRYVGHDLTNIFDTRSLNAPGADNSWQRPSIINGMDEIVVFDQTEAAFNWIVYDLETFTEKYAVPNPSTPESSSFQGSMISPDKMANSSGSTGYYIADVLTGGNAIQRTEAWSGSKVHNEIGKSNYGAIESLDPTWRVRDLGTGEELATGTFTFQPSWNNGGFLPSTNQAVYTDDVSDNIILVDLVNGGAKDYTISQADSGYLLFFVSTTLSNFILPTGLSIGTHVRLGNTTGLFFLDNQSGEIITGDTINVDIGQQLDLTKTDATNWIAELRDA